MFQTKVLVDKDKRGCINSLNLESDFHGYLKVNVIFLKLEPYIDAGF